MVCVTKIAYSFKHLSPQNIPNSPINRSRVNLCSSILLCWTSSLTQSCYHLFEKEFILLYLCYATLCENVYFVFVVKCAIYSCLDS
jgi:hypothetical protein